LLAGLTALAAGCSQPDGPVGSNVGGGPEGRIRSVVCEALADTSYKVPRVGTGGSAHLYVGSSHDLTSYAIARFHRPKKTYEMTVDSARFSLAWQGGVGAGTFPTVEGNLAIFPWSESSPPADGDVPAGTPLNLRVDAPGDSGFLSFAVPTTEITSWLAWFDSSAIDTNWQDTVRIDSALTLALRAPGAVDKLIRFRARSATADSLRPYLIIYATVKDSAADIPHDSTFRVPAAMDMFLMNDAGAVPAERVVVGGGGGIRSAVKFDLTPLWAAQDTHIVVVNRAVLTLHRDRALYDWVQWSRSVWPYRMTTNDWLTTPDSADFGGFTLSPTAVDSASDTLQIVVTSPAAEWAKGDSLNFGLSLHSTSEGLDLERIAYFGRRAADPAQRPRLTIYYTELPK